jgi:Putative transposase
VPEFIRRFLIHVLPKGFHRIGHSGQLASTARTESRRLASCCPCPQSSPTPTSTEFVQQYPCCGGRLIVIETFQLGTHPPASEWT